jgi:diguanylate cyclase (GGDEF)-like protein
MTEAGKEVLEQLIDASHEAVLLVNLDHPDWPVLFANRAFVQVGGEAAQGKPVADVVEGLLGRELALEISETLRSRQETSYPVEVGGADYLLVLKPLPGPGEPRARHAALYFRVGGSRGAAGHEAQHALLNAKRRIRDLTREDPVTGLLNERAFREVLDHDWAVAARERGTLALVVFTLDDFEAYVGVFGRHAADSCLRRVGQSVRRCLRRASDVVARIGGDRLIVLSHTSDEQAVRDFSSQISTTVRDLGLHHPRSSFARFVTVSPCVRAVQSGDESVSAAQFLDALLREADEG